MSKYVYRIHNGNIQEICEGKIHSLRNSLKGLCYMNKALGI